MKQHILSTSLGQVALYWRDKVEALQVAYSYPELMGTVANDQLATRLVTSIIQPNTTFIDVGAHIGSIIAQVASTDPSVKIVAIEAIPEKVTKLQRRFPFVELHSCAVGDYSGEVSFFINKTRSGFSSLQKPTLDTEDKIVEITVPIRRLDEIVSPNNSIDIIKIDVEGAELAVLRGSAAILGNNRPVIMFESGPPIDKSLENLKQDLYDFLSKNSYRILIPNRVAHNDPGLSQHGFVESHLYPRRTTNYFAIPEERRIEIRDRARHVLNISA
jgi:FkbM family methyltransferase